ncbi:hypothetical protein TNCT_39511 [Trichonephila clavata]|uniref:Uncharacterized protein n=1 Tax=Trichonephila clavata TaxID=2740835 RepID=A0A8X6FE89_TRICU|nr:hypothetical protein TNCT_39511 [Trichonephila clavata]
MFFKNHLYSELSLSDSDRDRRPHRTKKIKYFEDLKFLNETNGEKNVFTSSISATFHEKRRLRNRPATTERHKRTLSFQESEQNATIGEKDETLLDPQSQSKTKEIEIATLSRQAKELKQELDEMMENNEELKILHTPHGKKLLSSKCNQGKSSELKRLLMNKEKEYQFDQLSQMIDAL